MQKRKEMFRKWIVVMLAIALFATSFTCFGTQAKAAEKSTNRMNVVFVLDLSGSMSLTDPGDLRYDAVELFTGVATESGNHMGAIVFDDDIVLKKEIAEMSGKETKDDLVKSLKKVKNRYGDTNIGAAIEEAVQMLQTGGNPDLSKAIILLSDGNTDLPKDKDGSMLKASLASKDNAITLARNEHIKIHSVCLNANNAADILELRDISDATGGEFVEVKKADDLKDVFTKFYQIIYGSELIDVVDERIPDNGELVKEFEIPELGVEEANLIINTLNPNTTYMLVTPEGYGLTQTEMEALETKAKTFTILKIQNPQAGVWGLKVRGVPKDHIIVNMIYNSDLSLNAEVASNSGGMVTIESQIQNGGNAVTDSAIYQKYTTVLTIENPASGDVQEINMQQGDGKAIVSIAAGDVSGKTLQTYCEIDHMVIRSQIFGTDGIAAEVEKGQTVKITKWKFPFSKGLQTEDLAQYFDTVDASLLSGLTCEISSSDFANDVVYIQQGTDLTIDVGQCKSGSLVVNGIVKGISVAELDVEIKIISALIILLPILLIVLVIAAICIILNIIKKEVIPGMISLSTFDNETGIYGSIQTVEGAKAPMLLSRYFSVEDPMGIPFQKVSLLHADQKKDSSYIWLKSGVDLYSTVDGGAKKNKRIKLADRMEVTVSPNQDLSKGIKITYSSANDDFGYY